MHWEAIIGAFLGAMAPGLAMLLLSLAGYLKARAAQISADAAAKNIALNNKKLDENTEITITAATAATKAAVLAEQGVKEIKELVTNGLVDKLAKVVKEEVSKS